MWRSNWAANHVMSSDGAAPRFTLLGIPSPQVPHFADTESVSASYVTSARLKDGCTGGAHRRRRFQAITVIHLAELQFRESITPF